MCHNICSLALTTREVCFQGLKIESIGTRVGGVIRRELCHKHAQAGWAPAARPGEEKSHAHWMAASSSHILV